MPFNSGNLSFSRYHISGQLPSQMDESMLEAIASHLFKVPEVGVPEEVEWGWAGPNHIDDRDISFENCVFNDCIHFAIRIDTNKVPAEVKNAWKLSAEAEIAKGNPSGFISKAQKQQVKLDLSRKLDDELRSGKHRRSKHVPILWDLVKREIYAPASESVHEKLTELIYRTFNLYIERMTSGSMALAYAENFDRRRTYEDLTPTRFVKCESDPDMPAEYPWTAKSAGAKDYLGNEFLMWLWYVCNTNNVQFGKNVLFVIDKQFDVDCIYGCSGKDSIRGLSPGIMPEAIAAIRTGKVPRKIGLIMYCNDDPFNLAICGESFSVSGLKMPDIETADTPRHVLEQRIDLLRTFIGSMQSLYYRFLKIRFSEWSQTRSEIEKYITTVSTKREVA